MTEPVQSLEAFIDELMEAKGLTDLSPAEREETRGDLFDQLEVRINTAVLEALPPEAFENFQELLESVADEDALHAFIREHVPNLGEVIAVELIRFRKEYLNEDE